MLSLSIASAPLDGPQRNLTFPRAVADYAWIFFYARYGDVQGIKSLFMSREASPRDMRSVDGFTALHVG